MLSRAGQRQRQLASHQSAVNQPPYYSTVHCTGLIIYRSSSSVLSLAGSMSSSSSVPSSSSSSSSPISPFRSCYFGSCLLLYSVTLLLAFISLFPAIQFYSYQFDGSFASIHIDSNLWDFCATSSSSPGSGPSCHRLTDLCQTSIQNFSFDFCILTRAVQAFSILSFIANAIVLVALYYLIRRSFIQFLRLSFLVFSFLSLSFSVVNFALVDTLYTHDLYQYAQAVYSVAIPDHSLSFGPGYAMAISCMTLQAFAFFFLFLTYFGLKSHFPRIIQWTWTEFFTQFRQGFPELEAGSVGFFPLEERSQSQPFHAINEQRSEDMTIESPDDEKKSDADLEYGKRRSRFQPSPAESLNDPNDLDDGL